MRTHSRLLAATIALGLAAGTAGAQQPTSVFSQVFQPNPFAAMQRSAFSLGGTLGGEVANNVLNLGDAASIFILACNPANGNLLGKCSDSTVMRPSDLLLIAGVLPNKEDARLRMNFAADMRLTIPLPWGTLALTSAARSIARMNVPENMTALLRNGFTGDSLSVNLGGLTGSGVAYADLGALWLQDLGFLSNAGRHIRGGLGVHRLQPVSNPTVSFLGTDAAHTPSRVTITVRDSISANITMITPTDPMVKDGQGWAFDGYVSADLGSKLQVTGLLSNFGSMTVTQRPMERRRLNASHMDYDTFSRKLDSMTVDTIPGTTETVTLPASLRIEASYRPYRRLGLGISVDKAFGSEWAMDDLRTTEVVEVPLISWIPFRFGTNTGTTFGVSAFAGVGLRTRHFVSEVELVSRGFPFDKTRGGALRTGGAIIF